MKNNIAKAVVEHYCEAKNINQSFKTIRELGK